MVSIESFYKPTFQEIRSNISGPQRSDEKKEEDKEHEYPPGEEWKKGYTPPPKLPQEDIIEKDKTRDPRKPSPNIPE